MYILYKTQKKGYEYMALTIPNNSYNRLGSFYFSQK